MVILKDDEDRIVPRARMQAGIDLCKKNITDFLEDAKLIIHEERLSHAYISVQFALEELGKILVFRNKLEIDQNDPLRITKKEAFQSHKRKTEKVWEFLDPKFKKIFDEGFFDRAFFEKGFFQTDTYAEYETRLDCAFVDYYAGNWHVGRDIKKELLVKLISHIEEKLPDA